MPTFHRILHQPSGETQSATGRAYRALKDEILRCILPPGIEIYEVATADRLGMSKTPIREALSMLVHEGFVDVRPRQGYRVTDVTISDVQDVFQMRLLLEPAAAELAAERATPDHLQLLRSLVEEPEADSYEERVKSITQFHEVLADASGSPRLSGTLRNLLEEVHRFFFLGLELDHVVSHRAEHRELLDALLKGNHHLAGEIARRQVEEGRLRVFEAILQSLADGTALADDVVLRPRARKQRIEF